MARTEQCGSVSISSWKEDGIAALWRRSEFLAKS